MVSENGIEGSSDNVVAGRWRIEKLLGEGSFGVVYKVEDLANPRKMFALKVL